MGGLQSSQRTAPRLECRPELDVPIRLVKSRASVREMSLPLTAALTALDSNVNEYYSAKKRGLSVLGLPANDESPARCRRLKGSLVRHCGKRTRPEQPAVRVLWSMALGGWHLT